MRKKPASYTAKAGKLVPTTAEELIIPDEAIAYVVSHYLQGKNKEGGVPVIIGISALVVETVLRLFIDWAAQNNYLHNGVLTIGGYKIN